MISEIRSSHIGKLLYVEGLVRKKTDVRPQVVSSKFECPSCGQIMLILQLDQSLKEPSKCSCGRKGKFLLVSKELVDAQGLVLEEIPESLEGGEQPKRINVFLKEDLVSPISEKRTNPGSKVKVFGILNEVPIILRTGGKGTRFELMLEANNVEASEENFYNIDISKEEEQKIIELSQDIRVYEKLIGSIAPSIYGYERIKEALVLQLLGGVQKKRKDGVTTRGDIHVLLVGDPGCIAGDSRVSMYYKGMVPIKGLGTSHLQEIREIVSQIRRDSSEKPYDFATRFHIYKNQPVISVMTETGKSVTSTYNQPFLTKKGWKRADKLVIGEKIRVMPSIPNTIKKLRPTNFTAAPKKSGHLKDNVAIPEYFTPELAGLCGYIIGDGNVHPNGYRITCYVNNEENDLIGKLSAHWLRTFNIEPVIITTMPRAEKFITDGISGLRQIISTQPLHLLEVSSRQASMNMSFLKEKVVPQAIFESPKRVVATFLSWLFEADGTVFGNGRGRTSVQLKSKSEQLLKDVQLLLLYFGIQARIIQDNLCIRRAHDIAMFSKCIGFQSEKKIGRMADVIISLKPRTEHRRKGLQRYERVAQIMPAGVIDVFDFEVPKSHRFVANGIVCHNSGKSQLLKRVSTIAPKGRYVSGKGVSGAGITAAVVRDELLGGWSLEAGALVLANNGLCAIDELDKMGDDDRDALHESMEQQSYHQDTEIMLSDGSTQKIGVLVDELFEKNPDKKIHGINCEILPVDCIEVLTTDFKKIFTTRVNRVSRHIAPEYFVEIEFSNGRKIAVTPEHPIFVFRGKPSEIPAEDIKVNDISYAPRKLPVKASAHLSPKLSRLLGYIASEGYTYMNKKHGYAEIGVSNTDKKIIDECVALFGEAFGVKVNVNIQKKGRRKELMTARISSNEIYRQFGREFPELMVKSREKRVPNKVKISSAESKREFLRAYFKGDGFVDSERFGYITSSYGMARDLQDLLLSANIWSYIATDKRNQTEYYKVVVSSTKSIKLFKKGIVTKDDLRLGRLEFFEMRSERKANYRDPVPTAIVKRIDGLLKRLRLSTGYFSTIIKKGQNSNTQIALGQLERVKTKLRQCQKAIEGSSSKSIRKSLSIPVAEIAKESNTSPSILYYIEAKTSLPMHAVVLEKTKTIAMTKLTAVESELNKILSILESELRLVTVKGVRIIENKGEKWVYDVTVEPTKTFISEGLVLHNTLSISKANIQATLLTRTTVLSAANPKLGRFDPYGILSEQLDLPPTLINRFDLIFPVKDVPEPVKDEKMAKHILALHQAPEMLEMEIPTALLKKYFAYARQRINPELTDGALNEIKDFYVQMRGLGATDERVVKAIPISARQLEALVRMAEASARVRLSGTVTRKDARRAIDLLSYCLVQVGLDKETGRIDIDRISTGIPASQRDRIYAIKSIITEMEGKIGKAIPIVDIIKAALDKGISEHDAEEVVQRLKLSGDIYEPRSGFVSRM
ncbi:hypothetical protein HYV82_06035, partial [Candidatus Woesearchaeota archaeon]|nr:hypothetical protein [Candidatus Woesearchaeota archaeon]